MAVNCWVPLNATAGFAGVTAIEVRVAGVTVNASLPDTVPETPAIEAVMTTLPWVRVLTKPLALTVATAGLGLVQVTLVVTSAVVESV